MPLPKSRPGFFAAGEFNNAHIEIEVFLDIVCPYSSKAFSVLKELNALYGKPNRVFWSIDKISISVLSVVQPWHFQSSILHRAVAAVHLAKPETVWPFFSELYASMAQFSDEEVAKLGQEDILWRASIIAERVTGIETSGLVTLAKSNESSDIMRAHARYGRQNGIHMTPSLLVNGCGVKDFSSLWTLNDWNEMLAPLLH